jgi:hypothetical protein
MSSPLNEAIREAYASASADVVYLDTLEISNPDIGSLWLVKDRVDHELTLETGATQLFTATGFRFTLPSAGENGLQELAIAVDNVDQRPSDFVKSALASFKPIVVKYRPYLHTDKTTPQMNPPLTLYLTDIVVTGVEVKGRATFADILNKRFPVEFYTRKRFPTLGA